MDVKELIQNQVYFHQSLLKYWPFDEEEEEE